MSQNSSHTESELDRLKHERDVFKKQFLKMRSNYENKIKELSILKELGNTLRSSHVYERDSLLKEQLKKVEKYTSFVSISLLLLDEKKDLLECVASSHENKPHIEQFFHGRDNNPARQVIQEKKPIIVNGKDMEYPTPSQDIPLFGSYLFIPLVDKIRTVGVCIFHHKNENGFDHNQVRFLSLVTDHMVTTISISRFYKQMLNEEGQRTLLSRFFSQTVIDKIFSSKENLRPGGERRTVTVLFADLRGFTAMSENLDQEQVVEILNGYFSRVTPIIFKHQGTLDKFMGDGLLAFFGAPISHDDDPLRAVQTAIDIISELGKINIQNKTKNWPPLHVSIGINAGEVVAGYIGSEEHMNYTVIGDAVNVASRIETAADYDEILISDSIYNEIQERLDQLKGCENITSIPPQKFKGKGEMINLYRVETNS